MQENEYNGYLQQITDGEATERKIIAILHTQPDKNPPQVRLYRKNFLNTVREKNRIVKEIYHTRIKNLLTLND